MLKHSLWTALGLCAVLGFTANGHAESRPLTLTPETTVIVDATQNAGGYLQWLLLKCVARHPDADRYAPGGEPTPDRAASPAFPLYRGAQGDRIPEGHAVIAIGNTPYLTPEDCARIRKHPGAVLLKRQGNVVIVAGDTPGDPWQGEMAALSYFLNHVADIRLYAPDPLWWSMPDERRIVVADLDVFHKPVFAKTTWSGAWYANFPRTWDRLNKPISQGAKLRANHAIIRYFDPDKYYEQYPQIYEKKQGTRPKPTGRYWNPCLSAKELPEIAMQEIRERMQQKNPPDFLPFGVMDCKFDCHCDACQASVRRTGSYSNLYYRFLNEVARQCAKEFPTLRLTSYIYSNVSQPPVGMRIEPNIVVDYVSKSYRWVDPEWAAATKRDIRAWSDLGAGWVIHDWSFAGITPRAYTRQFAHFLQWGHQNGMKGLYVEWSHFDVWHLEGARYWIMRQLETDPYQDVDALWRRYCEDVYGAGGEWMYRLFQHFADKHTFVNRYCSQDDWPKNEFALYTEEDLAYQRDLIERARAAAGDDPIIQRRFAEFMPHFRLHEVWVQAVGKPSRLAYRHAGEGVNAEALAFYVNDDGSTLRRAIAMYRRMRHTEDPEVQKVYQKFNFLPAYSYNYSRGLGQILKSVKAQAMARIDLSDPGPQTADALVTSAQTILRSHLPEQRDPDLVRRVEGLLAKTVWVPRGKAMPTIDGRLDDDAWQTAAELRDFSIRAILLPTKHQTTGKVMRVGDKLVFFLRCGQVGPIWAETPPDVETGTRIWRESSMEFFFGPTDASTVEQRWPFAQYIITSLGAWRGFAMAEGIRKDVEIAVVQDRQKGRYTIEAAFPLKTEQYDFTGETVLSFNLMRNVFSDDTTKADEMVGWAPIYFSARDAESRGELIMAGAE